MAIRERYKYSIHCTIKHSCCLHRTVFTLLLSSNRIRSNGSAGRESLQQLLLFYKPNPWLLIARCQQQQYRRTTTTATRITRAVEVWKGRACRALTTPITKRGRTVYGVQSIREEQRYGVSRIGNSNNHKEMRRGWYSNKRQLIPYKKSGKNVITIEQANTNP